MEGNNKVDNTERVERTRRLDSDQYDIAAIRTLIVESFTAQQLRRFCQDRLFLSPILVNLGPNYGLADIVDVLIDHCRAQALFPELLAEVREHNPRRYELYASQLGMDVELVAIDEQTHEMREVALARSLLLEIMPELGLVVQSLYKKGKSDFRDGRIHFDDLKSLVSSGGEASGSILLGALALLYTLGLVEIDSRGMVMVTSRHSDFALGSLGKFLIASTKAVSSQQLEIPTQSVVEFTTMLEKIREELPGVDKDPLHSRRIANVLIKSQREASTGLEDVYLFVYRSDWDQYHLIGHSQYYDHHDDRYVAHRAMEWHLGLRPDQYELDPRKLDDVSMRLRSIPNGAITEYTFSLKVMKKVKVPLRPKDPSKFRWFGWEEILRRQGRQGETIMESTAAVMNSISELDSVPVSVKSLDLGQGRRGW